MSIDNRSYSETFEDTQMQKDTILAKLRERGCRITKQRKIILDIILQRECSCCKEIYYKALQYDKSIGTATVYRMINTLEEIGAINRKNTYRIDRSMDCQEGKECIVVLDDNRRCCLKAKELEQVIQAGLLACGMINDQKISKIELRK